MRMCDSATFLHNPLEQRHKFEQVEFKTRRGTEELILGLARGDFMETALQCLQLFSSPQLCVEVGIQQGAKSVASEEDDKHVATVLLKCVRRLAFNLYLSNFKYSVPLSTVCG